MKILIAEDDLVSRRVLARFLEKWGHQVIVADDGQQAWASYQAERPEVVISDWMMPGIDGLELIRRIRAATPAEPQDGAPAYVYVVLLTAKTGRENLLEGLEAGADDFLGKPFDHEELRVRLRTAERLFSLESRLAQRNRELGAANARLSAANARLTRDLAAAAKVQQTLLPTETAEIPGVRTAWKFRPCDELAGDLLNVLRIDERTVGLFVLDVSGHGVAAALMSVMVGRAVSRLTNPDSTLRRRVAATQANHSGSAADSHPAPPALVLHELFRLFPHDEATGQYFTLVFAVLDLATGVLRVASAGHPRPVLLLGEAAPTFAEVEGFPIGLLYDLPCPEYAEATVQLRPGDRVLLYSDGITDAMTAERDLFGEDRLLASWAASRRTGLDESLAKLMSDADAWRKGAAQNDDVSLLALELA